ncbi:MAG: hypothetical protein KatS3mg111_3877 [Pirellulaceae bacterium]|nr:MAG: hypothetical protein KatS3mg111_3877 [Pirellulaceae bacterium]
MQWKPELLWAIAFSASAFALCWQAFTRAPVGDEVAHLYSSVAMVRTGDPGYDRGNPPLPQIISGAFVEALFHPSIPRLYDASAMPSGSRLEYRLGVDAILENAQEYRWHFFLGRLARVAIVVFSGSFLLWGLPRVLRTAGRVAALLYLSSPLVLGHGWTLMPDALAGCMMIVLIVLSIHWLKIRRLPRSILVGLAWGAAFSTKFTFLPIYLFWPIGLLAHEAAISHFSAKKVVWLLGSHMLHGGIALLVVHWVYGFHQPFAILEQHHFQSARFKHLTQPFEDWRSPFPQQFLVGIDEQQLEIEKCYPTYILGRHYEVAPWWYYLIGLLCKEQMATVVGSILVVVAVAPVMRCAIFQGCKSIHPAKRQLVALVAMSAIITLLVLALFSSHRTMALNIRYLFPILPLGYLAIGAAVHLATWGRRYVRFSGYTVVVFLITIEVTSTFPHYYAYINPLFGGSYAATPALHDTNFDSGQDLWYLEKWIARNPPQPGTERFICIDADIPEELIQLDQRLPPTDLMMRLLRQDFGKPDHPDATPSAELIVMRCLQVPAPWSKVNHAGPEFHTWLRESATIAPHFFITPTLAVYRFY